MSPRLKAALLTVSAVLMWGLGPVGIRYLLGDDHDALPGAAFTGLRYGLGALCFLPAAISALKCWDRQDLLAGLGLGVLGVAGYNLPNAIGMRTVSAGMCGLLNAAEPLLIVLLLCLKDMRWPRGATLGAAMIGVSGIVLLAHEAGPAEGDVKGVGFCLLGALCWSGYCVLVPRLLAKHGELPVTAVTMICGAVPMLLAGSPEMGPMLREMTRMQWEITAALTLGPAVLAMLAWNKGAAGLGAEASGWFLYLLPVVSMIGGVVQLGEPFTWPELAGGGLILASVFLAQRV